MSTKNSIEYQTLLENQQRALKQMQQLANNGEATSDYTYESLLEHSLINTMDACLRDNDRINPIQLLFGANIIGNKRLSEKPPSEIIPELPKSEQYFYQTLQAYMQPIMADNKLDVLDKQIKCFSMINKITSNFITEKAPSRRLARIKMVSQFVVDDTINAQTDVPKPQ